MKCISFGYDSSMVAFAHAAHRAGNSSLECFQSHRPESLCFASSISVDYCNYWQCEAHGARMSCEFSLSTMWLKRKTKFIFFLKSTYPMKLNFRSISINNKFNYLHQHRNDQSGARETVHCAIEALPNRAISFAPPLVAQWAACFKSLIGGLPSFYRVCNRLKKIKNRTLEIRKKSVNQVY